AAFCSGVVAAFDPDGARVAMNWSNLRRISADCGAFVLVVAGVCWSSQVCAAAKRFHPGNVALIETSFHFGWKGGFCRISNLSKNACTKCSTLRYRSLPGAQL